MTKRPSNFDHNYPLVIDYLTKHELAYEEYNGGQHIKIAGPVAAIELWPGRMTYHILESEEPVTGDYRSLGYYFDADKLEKLLNEGA